MEVKEQDRDKKESELVSTHAAIQSPVEDGDTIKIKDAYLGSTQQHPFSEPRDAARWGNVYEKAKYEGRHRFDPSFQWDAATEKRLIRKVRP